MHVYVSSWRNYKTRTSERGCTATHTTSDTFEPVNGIHMAYTFEPDKFPVLAHRVCLALFRHQYLVHDDSHAGRTLAGNCTSLELLVLYCVDAEAFDIDMGKVALRWMKRASKVQKRKYAFT